MKNLNFDAERLIDELMGSNNMEAVNSVCGCSESSDILDDLLAASNFDSEGECLDDPEDSCENGNGGCTSNDDPFYDNEAWNAHCDEMNAKKQVDNGKNASIDWSSDRFDTSKSCGTFECSQVDGVEYGSNGAGPSFIQKETQPVWEGRTEESESVVQNQQPAPPVYSEQKVQKSKNPFAVVKSASDESATQPVQQPNSTETTIGAGNTGSETNTESVPAQKQGESTKSEKPAVQKKNIGTKEFLIQMVRSQEYFYDQFKTLYVTIKNGSVTTDVEIGSQEFEDELAELAAGEGHLINSNVKGLLRVARSTAKKRNQEIPIYIRSNFDDGRLVLDLNNGNDTIVFANKDGWKIIPKGKYKFHRPSYSKSLPIPIANGSIIDFLDLLHLTNPRERVMVGVWIVAALNTRMTRPILMFEGSAGSTKTTMAEMVRGVLDPIVAKGIGAPSNERDFGVSMKKHQIPSYDNIGKICSIIQDLMCRVVTGGAIERRKLYTDNDSIFISFKRAMILTAVKNPITQDDLHSRTIVIHPPLIKFGYKVDDDVLGPFNEKLPSILGGVLDTFVEALKIYPRVNKEITSFHRLAEFFIFGSAIAEVIGRKDASFSRRKFALAFIETVHMKYSKLIITLNDFLEDYAAENVGLDKYEFQAGKLFAALGEYVKWNPSVNIKDIAKHSNKFTPALDEVKHILEHIGWNLESTMKCGYKVLIFSRTKEIK